MELPAVIRLHAAGLACSRGERRLFSEISFALHAGSVLLVRGPNGSGKTSLLRIVCGLLAPDGGEVSWDGRGIRELGDEYRERLCYVGHLNAIKDELDPAENLRTAARIAGLRSSPADVDRALDALEIGHCKGLTCKLLSQGQKRRVALARLVLGETCPLWVLDEPFAGLDARSAQLARALVENHLRGGGIALLTTHEQPAFSAGAVRELELGR